MLAEMEPDQDVKDDWRFAMLNCTIANAYRDHKVRPSPFRIEDFLLKFKQPDEVLEKPNVISRDEAMKRLATFASM